MRPAPILRRPRKQGAAVPATASTCPQQRKGSKRKNACVRLASPGVKRPLWVPGKLYCHCSLLGSGAAGLSPQRRSARRSGSSPTGCSAPWAHSPGGRTRPPGGGTHPGSRLSAGRGPALPAGGAALARAEAAQLGARPPPKPRTIPSPVLLSRNCGPTCRPLVWDSRLHPIPTPVGLL